MTDSSKIFSLEGRGLKLTSEADLEPHIASLRSQDDVEEVRILGNTLGIGACKLLGEVLSTKKSLKVSFAAHDLAAVAITNIHLGRQLRGHLHRPTP